MHKLCNKTQKQAVTEGFASCERLRSSGLDVGKLKFGGRSLRIASERERERQRQREESERFL